MTRREPPSGRGRRERRFFRRTLSETPDLAVAMTFARSAGRGVVVIDKNEDLLVWQGPRSPSRRRESVMPLDGCRTDD
jgi:hypothetical protein